MKKNLKASSIKTNLNTTFQKKLNKTNIDKDFDFNKSYGAINYFNKGKEDNHRIVYTSNQTFVMKKKEIYMSGKIQPKLDKLNMTNSKIKRISIEEEKHSSYTANHSKVNLIEEYKGLGLSCKLNSNIKNDKTKHKKTMPNLRYNNIKLSVKENSYRTFSFEINNSYKKEKKKQFSKYNQNNYSNNKENILKKPKIDKKIENKNLREFPKYEKTMDFKLLNKNKKNEKKEEDDDEWNIDQYKGLRKTTMYVSRLKNNLNKANKLNKINSEFSTHTLIKLCKATSVAGRDENGLKKINQDNYVLERNVNGVLNFNIFGVLDGHGINGHLVSEFVSRYIINRIKNHNLIKDLKNPKDIYYKLKANGYEIIANIFTDADIQITKQKFNCEMSGTTCIIVIQLEEHIISANTGDSRGIMIFDDSNSNNLSNTKIYPLSYDCKPENPMEKQRIMECGGIVKQITDEKGNGLGPYRVWIKGETYPGLAMSRSIGDLEAKTVGVIPNPQIIEYVITRKTKFMIICSDGIWEFISNEEAMEIGNKYYLRNDPLGLCNELTNKSIDKWIKEDVVIDDITVVVAFF